MVLSVHCMYRFQTKCRFQVLWDRWALWESVDDCLEPNLAPLSLCTSSVGKQPAIAKNYVVQALPGLKYFLWRLDTHLTCWVLRIYMSPCGIHILVNITIITFMLPPVLIWPDMFPNTWIIIFLEKNGHRPFRMCALKSCVLASMILSANLGDSSSCPMKQFCFARLPVIKCYPHLQGFWLRFSAITLLVLESDSTLRDFLLQKLSTSFYSAQRLVTNAIHIFKDPVCESRTKLPALVPACLDGMFRRLLYILVGLTSHEQ